VLAVLLAAAYVGVSYEIAAGVTKAERKPFEDDPAKHGIAYQVVDFPSREQGISLNGWLIGQDPARPAIVMVHGIDSQRTADGAVGLAGDLHHAGFNVFMFDLRGHGTSGDGRISAGYYERQDVLGAVDYLVSKGTPSERIGLLGFSMGAAIVVMTAADDQRIRAIAIDSTYAKARELIAQEVDRKTPVPERVVPVFLPFAELLAKVMYGIEVSELEPERHVQKLGYPIFQLHSTGDTRIPFSHGQRVHDAAPAGSEFWVIQDSEHTEGYMDHPEEYVRRVGGYFKARLEAAVQGTP
jgi:pimeloyl-ACP methyl ester carboxylesterase